jgi:translocator protein
MTKFVPSAATAYCIIAALTIVAAAIGSAASFSAPSFYARLTQPTWAPPAWIFGPVWTVLYIMMGVAACLVVKARGWRASLPTLALYAFQLVLNALWTWLFFYWHLGGLATAEILLLWLTIALTCLAFWRSRALSGMLLLPYLAWVSFATALCWTMWRLNPAL